MKRALPYVLFVFMAALVAQQPTPPPGFPGTYKDISTPTKPKSGYTKAYTKSGTVCALNPSGTETCTGSGSGGTPGGADTEVQFNDASAFGGDSGFTYNKTTNVVTALGGYAGDPTKSTALRLLGATSGESGFTVNDVAGTAITYIMPAANGVAGQILYDSGVATCPTLAAGAPATCHQLAWAFRAETVGAVFVSDVALVAGTTIGQSLIYAAPLDFACTVASWTVTVDAGTIGFRVWRAAAGTAVPVIGDTLNSGDLAIASGTNLKSTTMTNFTGGVAPALAIGDILAFQLNAAATAKYAAVSLQCQK